jgi:hypothetical protein
VYCDRYTVASIPYAFTTGSGTSIRLGDDQVSTALPIGFNFNFYCNNYSNFYISSNGFITFDGAAGSGCCGGQVLPNTFTPNNLIALAWDDLYPPGAGASIDYYTTGTAPNRKLIVNYNDLPLCCSGPSHMKGQIVLYESSNVIETYITYASSINPGTCGIENFDGTVGLAAPGRNGVAWPSISGEAWQFSPTTYLTPGRTLSFDWTPTAGLDDSTSLTPIATVNQNTTYILHVTDGFCDRWDSMHIIVDHITTQGSADTSICYGQSVNLFETGIPGPLNSFNWLPSRWLSSSIIQNPVARPDSSISYTVDFKDSLMCPVHDSIYILVHPILAIDLVPDSTYRCFGDSAYWTALNGYFRSYAWNSGETTPDIWEHTTGSYYVAATDTFGCVSHSDTVKLAIKPLPHVNLTPDSTYVCVGDTHTWHADSSYFAHYQWNRGDTTPYLSATAPGHYWVILTDIYGCIGGSDTVALGNVAWPVISLTPHTDSICPGFSTMLTVLAPPAPTTISWNPGGSVSTTQLANLAGNYVVTFNDRGCISKDSAQVYNRFPPVINNLADTGICCPTCYTLVPDGGSFNTYAWSTGETTPTITVCNTGDYIVTVTGSNTCSITDTAHITRYCIQPVAISTPDSVFNGHPATLTVTTAYTFPFQYSWNPSTALDDPSAGNPISTPHNTITYTVTVHDTLHGCTDTATVTVNVKQAGYFVVPDAFTPNGDGVNDRMYPVLDPTAGTEVLEFKIFNRWGEMVYSNPTQPGWDGNFMGQPQQIGTFIYTAKVRHADQAQQGTVIETMVQGTFSLIR